jgi:thiol-disulfide isomerase/thioredoxin
MTRRLHPTARRLAVVAGCMALWLTPRLALSDPATLDFELSDGVRFVRLSDLAGMPTVINFWHADCAPCLRELPVLAELARSGQARVITIALHKPERMVTQSQTISASLRSPLLSLQAPNEPRGLLARFGNRSGALPHTVVLNAQRRPCAQRTGEIDAPWLARGLRECGN